MIPWNLSSRKLKKLNVVTVLWINLFLYDSDVMIEKVKKYCISKLLVSLLGNQSVSRAIIQSLVFCDL